MAGYGTRVVGTRMPDYDVYIGRAGRGQEGYFGNPYPVKQVCTRCRKFHATAESTIPCFTGYFNERLLKDDEFRRRVWELRGKRLGCPGNCKDKGTPCHGDVIAAWIEGI